MEGDEISNFHIASLTFVREHDARNIQRFIARVPRKFDEDLFNNPGTQYMFPPGIVIAASVKGVSDY